MISYNPNNGNEESRQWAHADRIGSVVATTDDTGALIDRYRYSPYGVSGTEGDTGFPFRFTGQKLYAASGLYHYKARWYDSEVGRFMQTDPIGYDDQMNLYAYVGNDPVNLLDPAGEFLTPATTAKLTQVGANTGAFVGVTAAAPLIVAGALVNLVASSSTAIDDDISDYHGEVNMDTDALVAVIETPDTIAGANANALLGDRTPVVSPQAASEFLVKGDPKALAGFMAERGGVMAHEPTHETVSALMMTGIDAGDAKVVAAGIESGGLQTLTGDKRLANKAPQFTERFLKE